MKHRIVILVTWFGQWPFWMDFFMQSCKWNKDVHWKIITDCGDVDNPAENVELVQTSFSDFSSLVGQRLGIDFQPKGAYKFCDIKPVLGYIFEEQIKEYTFWAFGDLDVIYGDLRAYYTDALLDKYDLISTHVTRISGHLCLLRNTEAMRNVFRKIPDWQTVLEVPEHQVFDEKYFSKLFVRNKNWPYLVRRALDQLSPLRRKALFREAFSTPNLRFSWTDGSRNFPDIWFWEKGQLTNDLDGDRQFPYLHFMHWKRVWSSPDYEPAEWNSVHSFQVTEKGFSVSSSR